MFTTALLRGVARLLIVTVTAMSLQPLTVAAQAQASAPAPRAATVGERYAKQLGDIEETLMGAAPQVFYKGKLPADFATVKAKVKTLREQSRQLQQDEAAAEAEFDAIEQHLRDKNLPPEILNRHSAMLADYQVRKTEFKRLMQAVEAADDAQGDLYGPLDGLARFMAKYPNRKAHTPTDPNNLPWGSPKPVTREPYTTPAQFQLSRLFGGPVKLAAVASLSGLGLPSTTLPATPTADDLAETEDVQLTQAIRAQADALSRNPVAIYNWVRNTIEFIPSYGSIQGADLTLTTRRGNAFDSASLLIALLRASGIAARYVYGTVEVSADQVMNWVGGVAVPQAAQNLMGQGGIPNMGLASGGQIKAIRFEHVWVEAYVDYVPSRGAKHITGDTWVPMDGSFKQYAYTQGMDLKTQVPLDAQALLDQAKTGATINETEGWVQNLNLNQTNLQTVLTTYQNQVKSYIDAQKPNATVGEVLGTKSIVAQTYSVLMGTLPYKIVATGAKMAALSDNLRWNYRTTLTDEYGVTEYASISQSTAALAGKKITISFVPATQADLDFISSYLPKPHADGTPIQPSELPSSLPGYLLHLKAEIRVDGQLASQSTASMTMGQILAQATALFNPASQSWEEGEPNQPVAGDYHAIALDLQGTGANQLTALKTKLEATKAKLDQFQQNPSDSTPILNLTKEDLSGDLLYAGILGYFASVDGSDQLAARASGGIVNYRLPSYGAFAASAQPHYWFGIVRSVSFPGVTMDVDRVFYQVEAKDYDRAKKLAYTRQAGAAGSAFEHAVPERLFIDTTRCNTPGTANPDPAKPACAQGVSAVKALAIAAAQGQRIYTLNQANHAYHAAILSQLAIDADVKTEIANALAAGKEVTTHQADITVSGWTGSGYILLDPDTGAGAYKISGGSNGSWVELLQFAITVILAALLIFAAGALIVSGAWFIGTGLLAWEVFAFADFIHKLAMIDNAADFNSWAAAMVITEIVGLIPVLQVGGALAAVIQYAFLILFAEFKMVWFRFE